MHVYGNSVRRTALDLHRDGMSAAEISRRVSVSRSAVAEWVRDPGHALANRSAARCFVCCGAPCPFPTQYGYLLGQYLGDGYLVTNVRVPRLRVACAATYPEIAAQVADAMRSLGGNSVSAVSGVGYADTGCYWMHWPCLFPQHGPGRKQERRIVLTSWQQDLVAAHPWALIRGLIHSDGCRSVNTVRTRGTEYRYVRYFFANESRDILAILGAVLDQVGVQWRYNRPNSISVARRASVAALEARIGPKS